MNILHASFIRPLKTNYIWMKKPTKNKPMQFCLMIGHSSGAKTNASSTVSPGMFFLQMLLLS